MGTSLPWTKRENSPFTASLSLSPIHLGNQFIRFQGFPLSGIHISIEQSLALASLSLNFLLFPRSLASYFLWMQDKEPSREKQCNAKEL